MAAFAGAGAAAADAPTPLLSFYPQAGTLGEDLFVANDVDLQDGPGILDFACSHDTYDGHTGQDTGIRSFREVAIGVPVFAALDGRVFSIQFAVGGDLNWGATVSRFDNHIILDHGGGVYTIYGHLARRSIKLKKGQWIPAGAQIGLTASSGNSSGPHLHFTVQSQGAIIEPFAGECRPGSSGWSNQPVLDRAAYVGNVTLSAKPFSGRRDIPYDEAVRTGTFVRGVRDVYVRVELRNWRGGAGTINAHAARRERRRDGRGRRAEFPVRLDERRGCGSIWRSWEAGRSATHSTGRCSQRRRSTSSRPRARRTTAHRDR